MAPVPIIVPVRPDNRYLTFTPWDTIENMPTIGPMENGDIYNISHDLRARAHKRGNWNVIDDGHYIDSASCVIETGPTLSFGGPTIVDSSIAVFNISTPTYPETSTYYMTATLSTPADLITRRVKVITGIQYIDLPTKNPQEDYWVLLDLAARRNGNGESDWLDPGETLTGVTVTPTNVTKDSHDFTYNDSTGVLLKLSGGTAGNIAKVKSVITTSASQTKTIRIRFAIGYR